MRIGESIVKMVRTHPLDSGVRSVIYLPNGESVHAIENDPIEPGAYFLRPDETGRFKNWVIECHLGSRIAIPRRSNLIDPRTDVEVHAGNTMSDTWGCTCPGLKTSSKGVVDSRAAIDKMRRVLERDHEDPPVWVLEISE